MFKTKHNLEFEMAPWEKNIDPTKQWHRFRVGTCEGIWSYSLTSYEILAITNNKPGNGHFEDVLQWFEQSCRIDNKSLMILEVWNSRFKAHLINKRNFKEVSKDNVELKFI